jgi:hypothetical protein
VHVHHTTQALHPTYAGETKNIHESAHCTFRPHPLTFWQIKAPRLDTSRGPTFHAHLHVFASEPNPCLAPVVEARKKNNNKEKQSEFVARDWEHLLPKKKMASAPFVVSMGER